MTRATLFGYGLMFLVFTLIACDSASQKTPKESRTNIASEHRDHRGSDDCKNHQDCREEDDSGPATRQQKNIDASNFHQTLNPDSGSTTSLAEPPTTLNSMPSNSEPDDSLLDPEDAMSSATSSDEMPEATTTRVTTSLSTTTATDAVSPAQIQAGERIYLANCGVGGICHTAAKNGPGNVIDNRTDQALMIAINNVPARPTGPLNLNDQDIRNLGAFLRAP